MRGTFLGISLSQYLLITSGRLIIEKFFGGVGLVISIPNYWPSYKLRRNIFWSMIGNKNYEFHYK